MKSLDELAIETGTDKNSNCHNYTPFYDKAFGDFRSKPINFLEIGVWHGDSTRMWREYFENAMIYGIDIDDMSQYNEERIKTFICNQGNASELNKLLDVLPKLDIVVSDGGHQSSDDIVSFQTIFPRLKSGGLYCIEDLLCSYVSKFNSGGGILDRLLKPMIDSVNMGGKMNHDWLCSNKKSEREKYDLTYDEYNIESVQFSCGLVIIKKF